MDVDAAPAAAASPEAIAEAADKDWQRLAAGLNLKNVAMLPAALHIRGHLTTAVLQPKAHLRNFFCPLFRGLLVYAKNKWSTVSNECAAKAAAARLGAHDALDAADGDGAEAAREIEEHAATLEEVAAVQAELDEDSDVACLLETDAVDQPHIAGLDPKYNQTGTPFFVDSTISLSRIARRLIGRHRKPVERLLSTQFSHENCGFSSTRSRSVNEYPSSAGPEKCGPNHPLFMQNHRRRGA